MFYYHLLHISPLALLCNVLLMLLTSVQHHYSCSVPEHTHTTPKSSSRLWSIYQVCRIKVLFSESRIFLFLNTTTISGCYQRALYSIRVWGGCLLYRYTALFNNTYSTTISSFEQISLFLLCVPFRLLSVVSPCFFRHFLSNFQRSPFSPLIPVVRFKFTGSPIFYSQRCI